MRRILFGAIWLTGFLAVLLSWGMMWGRAQGEGPSRIIAQTYSPNSSCQQEMIIPETGFRHQIQHITNPCSISPLGWSTDGKWFYYETAITSIDSNGKYRVIRTDREFHKEEVIIDSVAYADSIYLSRDTQYLIQSDSISKHVYSINTGNRTRRNLTESLPEGHLVALSPDGNSIIAAARNASVQWTWYQIAVDGSFLKPLEVDLSLLTNPDVILWSDTSAWIVLYQREDLTETSEKAWLYRMRPDGSDLTLFASSLNAPYYAIWVHPSGMVGVQEDNIFRAISVETGDTLWQLDDVTRTYLEAKWGYMLDQDWVHFRMTDGRLARCRFDGSSLTFYDPQNIRVLSIWGWTPNGEWVWFETDGGHGDFVDIMRLQRGTGKAELMVDEIEGRYYGWSPDGKWVYYNGHFMHLYRMPLEGKSQPDPVVGDKITTITAWTPPYQAEWQPTRTLTIGIGLMSFSTLLPTLHWIRRQRIA
ncbi:MAG: hypothetical protein BroJett018_54340 [Chloroflexota bacterium]|nr:MAG: hypothetical protein BroJett018_54340 [Chloroflexota bacterium]